MSLQHRPLASPRTSGVDNAQHGPTSTSSATHPHMHGQLPTHPHTLHQAPPYHSYPYTTYAHPMPSPTPAPELLAQGPPSFSSNADSFPPWPAGVEEVAPTSVANTGTGGAPGSSLNPGLNLDLGRRMSHDPSVYPHPYESPLITRPGLFDGHGHGHGHGHEHSQDQRHLFREKGDVVGERSDDTDSHSYDQRSAPPRASTFPEYAPHQHHAPRPYHQHHPHSQSPVQLQSHSYSRPMSMPTPNIQERPSTGTIVPSQPSRKRLRQLSLVHSKEPERPPPPPSETAERSSFWAARHPDGFESQPGPQSQAHTQPPHHSLTSAKVSSHDHSYDLQHDQKPVLVPAVLFREKKQKACSNCRRAKLKCIVGSGETQCVRCKVRKESCVFVPRPQDDDWPQTLISDMNAANTHLANLSVAVHHILHHLVEGKIIPPFTTPDLPDGLEKYEPPKRELPIGLNANHKTLRRSEVRDVGEEIMKNGRKVEQMLLHPEEDEANIDHGAEEDLPTNRPSTSISVTSDTSSMAHNENARLAPGLSPNDPSGKNGDRSWGPSLSPQAPHSFPSNFVVSPPRPFVSPPLAMHTDPNPITCLLTSSPMHSDRPSTASRTAIPLAQKSQLETSVSSSVFPLRPEISSSMRGPHSFPLREATPTSKALPVPKDLIAVSSLTHHSETRPLDLEMGQYHANDSGSKEVPMAYSAQGSISVLPTHAQTGGMDEQNTVIGSLDPRSDVVKKNIVRSQDALGLVSYFHAHLGSFLYGYNLQFKQFPYIGGPAVMTPFQLAVLCLISSERFAELHHYHAPLADEVLLLLKTSPAESWQRFEGQYTADFGDVDSDEPLDAEFGLGPEEIVAACILATYMTEREEAALIAGSAFRWARGWIRLLSSTPPRVTLAETAGFVPPERQASAQDMARIWLLCYIVDSTERLQLSFPPPPLRDPQSFYEILLPPQHPGTEGLVSPHGTNADSHDLLLTFHARLMTILNDWRSRFQALVTSSTSSLSATPLIRSLNMGNSVFSEENRHTSIGGPASAMQYLESLKKLAEKIDQQLDWWKDQFDGRISGSISTVIHNASPLIRPAFAKKGLGVGGEVSQWSKHIEITWCFVKMSVNGTLSQSLVLSRRKQHRQPQASGHGSAGHVPAQLTSRRIRDSHYNAAHTQDRENYKIDEQEESEHDDYKMKEKSRKIVLDSARRFMEICQSWDPQQDLTNLSPTYLFFVTLAGSELVQSVKDWKEGKTDIKLTSDDVIPLLRSVGEMLFLGELHQQHVTRTTAKTLFSYCEQLQKLR